MYAGAGVGATSNWLIWVFRRRHPDCLLYRGTPEYFTFSSLYQVVSALWACVVRIYNHAPSWAFINVQCRTFQCLSAEFASLASGRPACPDRGEANPLSNVRRRGCAGNASAPVARYVTKPMQRLPFVRNIADNGGLWAIRRIPAIGASGLAARQTFNAEDMI
jgi:hypothetical protein